MISVAKFREVCHRHGLAATHQRQVIYEAVMALEGHPSREAVFDHVCKRIPSISLGTVYKNIRTFLDSGILREVSVHHGLLRVDANHRPHHHFVCTNCKTILDLPEEELVPAQLRHKLPRGFQVQKFVVDVIGLCPKCSTQPKSSSKH
jgi:Fur family transcriptional regulator, peroxide stress response regulator